MIVTREEVIRQTIVIGHMPREIPSATAAMLSTMGVN